MIYDYLIKTFNKGEPFFLSEIPTKSKAYLKLEMKRLVDKGLVSRYLKGVYYLPYKTILGTDGKVLLEDYIKKRYLYNSDKRIGFYNGLRLANKYGFTTQNSAIYEFYTNNATTRQRTLTIDERKIVIRKPYAEITRSNINELEFLELMRVLYKYAEISESEIERELKNYIKEKDIDFNKVKKLINYYPSIVYKNLYKSGIIYEME